MSYSAYPLNVRAKEAPSYWQPSTLYFVLATGVQTNNAFTLIYQIIYDKGWAIKSRTHTQDRGVYILKGQCTFRFGPTRILTAKAGDFVAIPKLTKHSFTVDAEITELLDFYTPAGYDQIIIGTSHPALMPGPPPSDLPLASSHQIKTLYAQYGLKDIGSVPTIDESKKQPSRQLTEVTPAEAPSPFLTNRQTAPAYWVMPVIPELWVVLASGEQTNNAYTLTEMLFTKGNAAAPMEYGSTDETYYVLDGKATFLLGDHVEEAGKGDFVFIPRGTIFGLRVDSAQMRALLWHTPSGIIEGALPLLGGKLAKDRTSPPADLERPSVDPEVFMAHARALQIRILAVSDPLKQ
jgi:mannose-6-phosphate isomerase-like protein (cupin superfamily)